MANEASWDDTGPLRWQRAIDVKSKGGTNLGGKDDDALGFVHVRFKVLRDIKWRKSVPWKLTAVELERPEVEMGGTAVREGSSCAPARILEDKA